jgi:basic membrane protein A
MNRPTRAMAGVLLAASLFAAACGDDGGSSAATTTAAGSSTTAAVGASTTTASTGINLDTNGDGKIVLAVATPGPRNDGGYYQSLVDGVTKFSKDNGYKDPIVVDNIKTAEAATALDSLARQNVDAIVVGAGELADPLKDLTAKYDKIIWYCNCGGSPKNLPNLIESGDDGGEISYTAGVATGLLMKAKGVTKAAFIGNNNFNFEKQAFAAFKLGLDTIDKTYSWTYVGTNSFNDVAAATEAFNSLKSQGVGAVYPYLGGSHEAVVKLANQNNVIVMSAGDSKACARTDLKYDIAVKFSSGDYLATILSEIKSGKIKRGDRRVFHVGVDPQPGAEICKPTAEQTTIMKQAYADVASGKLKAALGAIAAEAYKS